MLHNLALNSRLFKQEKATNSQLKAKQTRTQSRAIDAFDCC